MIDRTLRIVLILLLLLLLRQTTTSFQPMKNTIPLKFTHNSDTIRAGINMSDTKDKDKNIISFSSVFFKKNFTNNEMNKQQSERILIILNYPIPKLSPLFDHLWNSSTIRIAADGGANRLYDYTKELGLEYIPNRIRGDLDSLKPTVRSYYEDQHNVIIEQDPCQDTNDLDKALQICCSSNNGNDNNDNGNDRCVIIYGAFGGRFDQEMASFAALYKWAPKINYQLYLYSDETCAFLIPANIKCEIRLPYYNDTHNFEEKDKKVDDENDNDDDDDDDDDIAKMVGEGPTCGLIPLGCRCESITTSGLMWDLDGTTPLVFGGLVSSSNRIMEPVVKVSSSHPIIFTAEILVSENKK
mmetsp:Transcript_33468/g.37564  ORF Transcript_33468/g.37564 Transcript_33468/m.37564 type:complete len:355 (+) Transcript_33468:87-1151(+)